MDFISLSNINAISSAAHGLMGSPLVQQIVTDEIFHSLFNMLRRKKGKKLSRSQRRKLANRRRRWFTDNIIMHHKRLHDRNREIVIASAKTKTLAKRLMEQHAPKPETTNKWRDRVDVRDKGRTVRGRVDARRSRARSRWLSVQDLDSSEVALAMADHARTAGG